MFSGGKEEYVDSICVNKTYDLYLWFIANSLVIKQKRESQNGGNKKAKHAKYSEKRSFLTRGLEMFVFRKLGVLCFLVTSVLRFALLLYYRRIVYLHIGMHVRNT